MKTKEKSKEKSKVKSKEKSKVWKKLLLIIAILFFVVLGYNLASRMLYAKMTFIGHATVKIVTRKGTVIYIDPDFSKGDYSQPADYILVTHGHSDHNNVSKCKKAPGCKVIKWRDALVDGKYQTFDEEDVHIEAVPSGGNSLHDPMVCVGYIITVDGVSVYHAGDTVMYDGLKEIVGKHIDYAMYPVDEVYTMTPAEAGEVADMIGATYNIPIHGGGIKDFPRQCKEFKAKGKLSLHWGQTIYLKKHRWLF